MTRKLRLVTVSCAVFLALWLGAEVLLSLMGVRTISEDERSIEFTRAFCERIRGKEVTFLSSPFFTDGEGVFRASPEFPFRDYSQFGEGVTVDKDGFRGERDQERCEGVRVLLLGDSFVWGIGATSVKKSFADLLRQAGYRVYNGGVPGTDPGQYAKVGRRLIPRLKPSWVVVCLYEGNDFRTTPQPQRPYGNLHYVTNFGWISGFDDEGRFFDGPDEALRYLKEKKCGDTASPRSRFLFRTRLGKLAYWAIRGRGRPAADKERNWVRTAVEEIASECSLVNARMIVVVVPSSGRDVSPFVSSEKHLQLLKIFDARRPGDFTVADYSEAPDNHFNDQGNARFAAFLVGLLAELREHPTVEERPRP
jgi:hypothetical protein